MKIELLYFEGCLTWRQTEADISSVLVERGRKDVIDFVKVETNEDAQRLRFVGSPSIRIDGVDIDPEAPTEGFNLECRIYWRGGRPAGVPPRELIERAVDRAMAPAQ